MEFNEKVWLRAAIKRIRPIIEYKINTGEEIDFKGLVIREKQTLRRWQEKEKPLKSTRLSQDYRKFLSKLDTLDDLLEQSTREISPAVCVSMILSETYQECPIYTQKYLKR